MPSVCVNLTKEELNHQHEQLLLTSLDSRNAFAYLKL